MSTDAAPLHTFKDASGKITVTVFMSTGAPDQEIWLDKETLLPDSDMVAIGGGGAATDGYVNTLSRPGGPGAFLTASYPNENLTGWYVSARDQETPQTYGLVSFVIGMKIAGMSPNQLRQHIVTPSGDSGAAGHPSATVGIKSNSFVLAGGGFRVDNGHANLGVASFPDSPFSWTARSQDHMVPDMANLRVWAIGISNKLPGVGQVLSNIQQSVPGVGIAPHPSAVATVERGYALTGGGAQVQPGVNGNLLWKLQPSTDQTPQYEVASADHQVSAPASILAYAVGLRIA